MQNQGNGLNISKLNRGGGKRLSNIESLRIVAMSMILIHHFLCHSLGFDYKIVYALNPLFYSGVTIFFMISGYFTIRYSLERFLRFMLLIVCFGAVNIILCFFTGSQPSILRCFTSVFFPNYGSPYWFIKVYSMLIIAAPILNYALDRLPHDRLRNTLILLLFYVFYGWYNYTEFSFLQGFYCYIAGYYLGRYRPFDNVKSGWYVAAFAVSCVAGIAGGLFMYHKGYIGQENYFDSYRSVFVFVSGASLLVLFSTKKFISLWVNRVAGAAFGCYLLQDGYFGANYFYEFQHQYFLTHEWQSTFLMFAATFIAIWIVSYILTRFFNTFIPQLSKILSCTAHRLMHRFFLFSKIMTNN